MPVLGTKKRRRLRWVPPQPYADQQKTNVRLNINTMNTQLPPTRTVCGKLAGKPVALVSVAFQAAKVVVGDDGYSIVPGTSVEDTVQMPAYRMEAHLEGHIAEHYPGLTLVDWGIK